MSFASGSKIWMDGPNKRAITLGSLLKSGGAGSVYQIREMSSLVAKIYHREQPLDVYERKVKAMLSLSPNLPDISDAGERYVQIAWPHAILRDERGKFLGFAMPSLDIKATSELEYILQERQARAEGLPVGLGAKITLAANLSAVIAELHKQHHYVVDMKPVNLRFYRRSLYMAMLDCDGFSIQGQNERFEAPQFTPDYLAPEFQASGLDVSGEEQQDRFALAVVIFQLMNFGIHPFTGRPNSDRVPTDIPGRIQARAYAYGLKPNKVITPSMVSGHDAITTHLRNLFDRAFESAGTSRPSAGEWAAALKQYAQKSTGSLLVCKSNKEHQYFSGLACAACARENLLKKARQAQPAPAIVNTPNTRKPYGRTPRNIRPLPAPRARAPVKHRPVTIAKSTPYPFTKYVPVYQPPSSNFLSQSIGTLIIRFPRLAIILLLFAFLMISRCSKGDFSTHDGGSSYIGSERARELQEAELAMMNKNAAKNFSYEVTHPPVPAPALDDTDRLITTAALAIAGGDFKESTVAMQLLDESANALNSSDPETAARHRAAFSKYLSSTNSTPGNIEERQRALKEEFAEILSRDQAAAQTSEELAWLYLTTNESANAQQMFKQAIWAKPRLATAWYGLGMSKLMEEDDEVVVGILTLAEQITDETYAAEKVRSRIEYIYFQLPAAEQKRFVVLQARAKQLIRDYREKNLQIKNDNGEPVAVTGK